MANESIYVVLVKAHTGLGSIGRKFMGYPYTHIALSLSPTLTEFITFSRRSHHAPLNAGFMRESRGCYAFGPHQSFKAKVFRVPITVAEKRRVLRYIQQIEQDEGYLFNMFSMATMPVLHGFRVYKAHNCMSFVGAVLQSLGAVKLQKPYYRYNIQEFDALLVPYLFYEGELEKDETGPDGYMDKSAGIKSIPKGAKTIAGLLGRMLFRRPNQDMAD